MSWNVAQAKQHLSEVLRLAAEEPQVIYNRSRPVAAVIPAQDLEAFQAWKTGQQAPQRTLVEEFAILRALAEGDDDPIPETDRFATMRPNAFEEMLDEEYP
ncbi:type II toxin-antitoxin system Phd/YefM family antitoxin [Pseudothauera nasutitermitis]|uniref:Antitoxin n=1 Tax=Pseudothauera nasutitermitis TaxID=2565930 RepID=A0A4S4B177_9RHOO|nr:type II toxin-antitoxin system prevent-host-death family antitoxin [Pseudothauera nasutitermitis]THF66274.1 type II toxin-antitoxin system Phd/YefM family antitoxin [Pseudothauera nasutitermitis]